MRRFISNLQTCYRWYNRENNGQIRLGLEFVMDKCIVAKAAYNRRDTKQRCLNSYENLIMHASLSSTTNADTKL